MLLAGASVPNTAEAADVKVGVVDVEAILEQVPERAEVERQLSEKFAVLQKEVDARWAEVASLSKELEGMDSSLSAKGQADFQAELIQKETALSEYWNKTAEKIRAETESVSAALSRRVEEVVTAFAKGNGYDLVFDKKSGKLVYSSESFDQTDAVLKAVLGMKPRSAEPVEKAKQP